MKIWWTNKQDKENLSKTKFYGGECPTIYSIVQNNVRGNLFKDIANAPTGVGNHCPTMGHVRKLVQLFYGRPRTSVLGLILVQFIIALQQGQTAIRKKVVNLIRKKRWNCDHAKSLLRTAAQEVTLPLSSSVRSSRFFLF